MAYPANYAPQYPSPYPPAYMPAGTPTPATRDADDRALSSVSLAAILLLVGTVVTFVVLFATPFSRLAGASTSVNGSTAALSLSGIYLIAALSAVSLIFTVIELLLFRQAFRMLAGHDARFSTPASLVLVLLVAVIFAVVGLVGLLYSLYEAILCSGSGATITSACVNAGNFLLLLAVIAVAAIAAIVGYIGLLLGIWRLGARFNESMFKVGAILQIIPLLNLVGVILILVAARSAREKLRGGPTAPAFG
jgi:Protein of unknown function (DUF973)